jgi:hypothetical protein
MSQSLSLIIEIILKPEIFDIYPRTTFYYKKLFSHILLVLFNYAVLLCRDNLKKHSFHIQSS